MGKKGGGGSQQVQQSPYEKAMANIAMEMYKRTDPIRGKLLEQGTGFLSGNYDVREMPQFAPIYANQRAGLEAQYDNARRNVMANTPQGGALTKALAELESSRAESVGGLEGQLTGSLATDLFNKTYGTAFGAPGEALTGLGGANASFTSRAAQQAAINQQNAAQNQGLFGMLGQGLGNLGAAAILSPTCCWIFIESNGGIIDPIVRRYRDEHMTDRNRRGYYRLAEKLVPVMRRSIIAHKLVEYLMTKPMTQYGRWYYGQNRLGFMFAPVKWFWMSVFNDIGSDLPFVRCTGEVI